MTNSRKEILISPSILSADFAKLGAEVEALTLAGADMIHIDVMDGMFVPNITFGPPVIKAIRKHSSAIFDVHLMIDTPERYIKEFADAGADIITVHAESTKHLHRTVQYIKSLGIKAGVSLNPATPLDVIKYLADDLYMVLLMTVNPGFPAQTFIDKSLEKIKDLHKMAPQLNIQVDGGINDITAGLCVECGANILVAGSYVFAGNYHDKIMQLKMIK